LLGDPSIQNVLKDENLPVDKLPPAWFRVSEAHLSGGNDHSLIVMADGRLRGANLTTFWVFRASAGGYEPLLSEPAHDLLIKDTISNGYRDIELSSASEAISWRDVFRFDGKSYQWQWTISEDHTDKHNYRVRFLDRANAGKSEEGGLQIDNEIRTSVKRQLKPNEAIKSYFPRFVKWAPDGSSLVVSVGVDTDSRHCFAFEVATQPLKITAVLDEPSLRQRYNASCETR
jgi:hypothetical protein